MKIKINDVIYDIIECYNTKHSFKDAYRDAKYICVDKSFDYSLFRDGVDWYLIDESGHEELMWQYKMLGEVNLKEKNNVIYMCAKTNEECLQEVLDAILGKMV